MRFNALVNSGNVLIGQQNHDDISRPHCVGHFHHIQARFGNFIPRGAAFAQANNDFYATVVQILGVCMALATVTNDRHGFTFNQAQVAVFVVINFHLNLR
jgi:hypothetical protein